MRIGVAVVLAACGHVDFDPRIPCIAQVAASESQTCVLHGSGWIECWGKNVNGELGDGTFVSRPLPATVVTSVAGPAFDHVVQISGGVGRTTCARRDDGTAWCWGENVDSQLGDGTVTNRATPVQVMASAGVPLIAVADMIDGEYHACVRKTDHTLWCWGLDARGQLGGVTMPSTSTVPLQVVDGALQPIIVASAIASYGHTCARNLTDEMSCWGTNNSGQLGDGTQSDRAHPVPVLGHVVAMASANVSTCAVTQDSGVQCTGNNSEGELGDGTLTSRSAFAPVLESPGGAPFAGAVDVGTGDGGACARKADGTVWCWGRGTNGQLGNNTMPAYSLSPVEVALTLPATALSLGNNHACAILADDTLWCWGLNSDGELGDGTTTNRATPVAIAVTCP